MKWWSWLLLAPLVVVGFSSTPTTSWPGSILSTDGDGTPHPRYPELGAPWRCVRWTTPETGSPTASTWPT